MKKFIVTILSLILILQTTNVYAFVDKLPEDMNLYVPNTFYYNYETDMFNDTAYTRPYLLCMSYGTFSNKVANNDTCTYLFALKKYANTNQNFFAINMLQFGKTPLVDTSNTFKAFVKVKGEIYEYQTTLYTSNMANNNFVVIDEIQNSELYNMIFTCLNSGNSFKLRLENSTGTDSYILEMPITNFIEAYYNFYKVASY